MTQAIGVRSTRQRAAVISALGSSAEFRSAQDLHRDMLAGGQKVGLTTVYRTLQALADAGEVDQLRRVDGEAVYRACSSEHHHHLVCRRCGRTVEVSAPAIERWAERTAAAHGFADVEHTVEVSGTCPHCR
jgi:Fur family transcriptional regulator, ferric uptake regulator